MKNNRTGIGQGSPKIEDLISLEQAATLCGLTQSHLRLFIRQGKIWGIKIGRNWITTEQAVREYQAHARPRGRPKMT